MSLTNLFEKLGKFTEKNRKFVFIGFVVLILVAVYGAMGITMNSGMDTYIHKDSKMYQDLDKYNSMFSQEAVIVMIEGADVYDPAVLRATERFENLMRNVSGVDAVGSPASIIKATNEQVTGRGEIPSTTEEVKALVDLNPSMYEGLIFGNTHSLIAITYSANLSEGQKEDITIAARNAANFSVFPPGYNLIITGDAALNADMNEEMGLTMALLLLLALLLMVVGLGLVFRGVRWRLYPLIVVVFGLIYTFGMMGSLHINMTMVSIAAFPILIALGIDYAIQFHNRMEEELSKGKERGQALISTFKYTGPAVMTALFVTCVSFVSLLVSGIPMIQDFGMLLIIGCIGSYAAALFFGTVSLYYMDALSEKIRKKEEETGIKSPLSRFFPAVKSRNSAGGANGTDEANRSDIRNNIVTSTLNKIIDFTLPHKKTIFMMAIVTGALGFYADTTIPAETDFTTYMPQDMPALLDFYRMGSVMGGSDTINIMIQTQDISSPHVLKWMDEFGTYQTRNQDYVFGADSLASIVKEYNGGVIPDTSEEIRAIYDQIPQSVMDRYSYGNSLLLLNLDVGSAVMNLPMESVKTLIEIVQEDLMWHPMPPGTTATITGGMVPYTELLDSLLSGRVQQTMLGILLVFIALLLIYRNIYKALTPVLTIGLVIGWSGLVMYTFNIVYTPMTAVMGCIILGAGSEYSILLMERYYEEKGHGLPPTEAMRSAVTNTGIALTVSGITTIFGFLALTASAFGIISSFGLVTVINMMMVLLASFVVFPLLMLTLDGYKDKGFKQTFNDFKNSIYSMVKINKKTEMI
ncbi:MAG: RND family transporter [Methanosarcinales archaeon]|jgi:hydrophobe/amphiphile efflux-3 (HAE3) family protein|nr:RND family transporter [Methanosarcinales archaeon]